MREQRLVQLQRSASDQGLIDGRIAQVTNISPSAYAVTGMDDYAKAYRAAYFNRATSGNSPAITVSLVSLTV